MAKSSIPAGSIVYDILADTRAFDATLSKLGQNSKLVVTFGQPDTKAFDQTIGKLGDRLEDVLKKVRPSVPPRVLDPLDAQIKALENSVKTYRREFQSGFGEPSRREIDQLRQRMSGLITEANKLKVGLKDDSDQMARLAQVTAQATRSISVAEGGISRLGLASQVAAGVNLAGFNNTLGNGVLQLAQFQDGLRSAKEQGISPMVLGFGVAAGAVGVLGVGLGKVVDVAADFEDALTGAATTLEATQQELGQLDDLARELGPSLGFGPTQGAKAFEELGSAGLTAIDVLEGAGEAALTLARATKVQGDTASEILGQAKNAFGLTGREFVTAADVITNAANQTILKAQDFRDVIGQGGAAAKIANQPFAEFAATIATTRNFFSSASDAGTSYKAFILALTPNSDAAAKAMKQLGFNAFDAAGNLKPIPVIVDQLKSSLAGLTQQQRLNLLEKIFGSDGARTAIALIESSGQKIRDLTTDLSRSGSAGEQAAKRLDTYRGSQENLKSALEKIATSEGPKGFIRFLTDLNNNLTDTLLGRVDNLASSILGLRDNLKELNKELGTNFKPGSKEAKTAQELKDRIDELVRRRSALSNADPNASIILFENGRVVVRAVRDEVARLNDEIGKTQKALTDLQKTNQAKPSPSQSTTSKPAKPDLQVPPVPFLQPDTRGVSQAAINLALQYVRAVEQAKVALEKAANEQERLNAAQKLQQAENNLDAFRNRNQQAAKAVEIANTIIEQEKRDAADRAKRARERQQENERAGQQAKKLRDDIAELNREFKKQIDSGQLTSDQVRTYARRLEELSGQAEDLGIRQRPVIDGLIDTGKALIQTGNAAVQFKQKADAARDSIVRLLAAQVDVTQRNGGSRGASGTIGQVIAVNALIDSGSASRGNIERATAAINQTLEAAQKGLVKLDANTKVFLENSLKRFDAYLKGLDEAYQRTLDRLEDAAARSSRGTELFKFEGNPASFKFLADLEARLKDSKVSLGEVDDLIEQLDQYSDDPNFGKWAAELRDRLLGVRDAAQAAQDAVATLARGTEFNLGNAPIDLGAFTELTGLGNIDTSNLEAVEQALKRAEEIAGNPAFGEYAIQWAQDIQAALKPVLERLRETRLALLETASAERGTEFNINLGSPASFAFLKNLEDRLDAGAIKVGEVDELIGGLDQYSNDPTFGKWALELQDRLKGVKRAAEEAQDAAASLGRGTEFDLNLGTLISPELLDELTKLQNVDLSDPDGLEQTLKRLDEIAGNPAFGQFAVDWAKELAAALREARNAAVEIDTALGVVTSDPLEDARANLDLTQKEFQAGLATAEDLSLAYQRLIDEITASIDTLGTDPENAERVRQLKLEVEELKKTLAALNLGFGDKILGGGDGLKKGLRGNLPPVGLKDFQFDTDPLRQQFQGVTDAFLNGLRDGLSRGDLLGGFGQGLLNVAKIFGDALLEQASKLLASEAFNALAGVLKPGQASNESGKGLGGAVAGIGSLFSGPLGIGLGILGFALPLLGDLFKGPAAVPEPAARPFGGSATTEFNISIENTWQFQGGFDDPRARAVIDSGIESGVVNALKRVGIVGSDGKLNPGLKAVMT